MTDPPAGNRLASRVNFARDHTIMAYDRIAGALGPGAWCAADGLVRGGAKCTGGQKKTKSCCSMALKFAEVYNEINAPKGQ